MKTIDVLVIGSCMTDLIAYTERLPKIGETIHGHKFTIGFGGKGANQCVSARKLGASTALVAKLGNDTFGENYKNHLKQHGVNIDHVKIVDNVSGIAQISVNNKGDNHIIIIAGANNDVSSEDVYEAEELIKSSKIVLFQFEIPMEPVITALELCRKYHCTTIVNAAPARTNIDSHIIKLADIFCVNEVEAELVTGQTVNSVSAAMNAANILLSMGSKLPIVTLGEKGAVFASSESKEPVHVPVKAVKPVDTTGAGDSFLGALAYFLAKFETLSTREVVRRACEVARYSVQQPGTQTSFPYSRDLPQELFSQ